MNFLRAIDAALSAPLRWLLRLYVCPHREEVIRRRPHGIVGHECLACLRFREIPRELVRPTALGARLVRQHQRLLRARAKARPKDAAPHVLPFLSRQEKKHA